VTIVFGDGLDQVVGLTGCLPLVLCTLKVLVLGVEDVLKFRGGRGRRILDEVSE